MSEAKQEHDEIALAKEWQAEARNQTLETLPAFLQKLADYPHDYGTIVRAIGAASVAAAWALNACPNGGITGFQASCVTWEFLTHWSGIEGPAWIGKGENLLFPQYAQQFTSISKETFQWLQEKAAANLRDKEGVEAVRAHWQSIANGTVPFGLRIRED